MSRCSPHSLAISFNDIWEHLVVELIGMPPQDLGSNNLSLPFTLVEQVAHKCQYTLPGDVVDPPDVLKYGPWDLAETELLQRYSVVPQCVPFIFINTEPLGQTR